jgi:hypothetical protein
MKTDEESAKAFDAFCAYRDLGPARSIAAAVEESGGGAGRMRTWEGWSSRYRWVERAAAYDSHIDQVRLTASADNVAMAALKHATAASRRIEKGLERLAELKPEDMSVLEVRQYISDGIRLHRLALGLSTESVRQEASVSVRTERMASVEQILADPEASRLACELTERIGGMNDEKRRDA